MTDALPDRSESQELAERIATALGRDMAHRAIDVICRRFTNVELSALAAYWKWWARRKQLAPGGPWRSWGTLAGRGWGKSLSCSHYVNEQVEAGHAKLICVIAQDEQSAVDIQVLGPSGLIATSPPWFKAEWVPTHSTVVWPNGAKAYVRTPEVPGKIRGLDYHLSWATEFQSWPTASREEAHENVMISTRLGYARLIWDATPKKRHPILRERLRMSDLEPEKHVVVRGTTYENAANLGEGYVEDMERRLGGTSRGREELLGEMLDDDDDALVRQEWIDRARRPAPDRYRRKALAIDPAVTSRKGSDNTGMSLTGLGHDGQGYVLGDYTGKHKPGAWATLAIDIYTRESCDVLVVETNKGGDLVVQNIRAAASERGLRVVVLGKEERAPEHLRGVLFIREVHSRGTKLDRAQPLAVAYEKGRVSHVIGAALSSLEETLTGWVPAPNAESPDDLDALVSGMSELLGLAQERVDNRKGFEGIAAMAKELRADPLTKPMVPRSFFGSGSGRGI